MKIASFFLSKVDWHEKCASRCCCLVDDLRNQKGVICDRIKVHFVEQEVNVDESEEQLLQEVQKWFNKQFELIKNAQKKEEQRIEKVSLFVICYKYFY